MDSEQRMEAPFFIVHTALSSSSDKDSIGTIIKVKGYQNNIVGDELWWLVVGNVFGI